MQAGLLRSFTVNAQRRGTVAWMISGVLFTFYILFYFTSIFDPVAKAIGLHSRWTLYGALYTMAMITGGIFFLRKHGNSRYHRIRTLTLIFIQSVVAFSIPLVMEVFNSKGYIFNIFWPLKIDYFYPDKIFDYPILIIVYTFLGALILVPLMTFFFGKRWYCSWVCGCGGLAETAGDSFRHLSSRKARAWRFEQISINTVMFVAFATTALVLINWGLHHTSPTGKWVTDYPTFNAIAMKVQGVYQFMVVAMLSGVFGVGLYPLMGNRVWCRFFCPLAAIMGLIQKFGRFRITVNPNMCISCGNCSTYC